MTQNINEIIKYINTLDVWIVSHGGCGSNYIVDLLNDNGLKVRDGPRKEAVYYGKSSPELKTSSNFISAFV